MSFFGKMFGGKKEQAPTTGEAIQKLRETENMLIKKQEFLESKIEEELNIARKNASKNKRGMCLMVKSEMLHWVPGFEAYKQRPLPSQFSHYDEMIIMVF